ncbi:MAG: AMIN domain-containing protein, partial [Myxococcota bacterium]
MIFRPLAPLPALALSALLVVPAAVRAEGLRRVDSIEVVQVPGVALEEAADIAVRAGATLEYTLFRLQNPARVVLDLPGADVSGFPSLTVAKSSLVKSVTTSQFRGASGEVARVVVQLTEDAESTAERRGNHVVLSVRRTVAGGASVVPAKTSSSPVNTTAVLELVGETDAPRAASKFLGVSARSSGEGSIVEIATDGPVQRYEMEEVEDPARLVVDLYEVSGPKGERKDLGVPAVERARVAAHQGRTRVVLDGRAGRLPHYDVAATDAGLRVVFRGGAEPRELGRAAELSGVGLEQKDGFWRLKLDVTAAATVRTVADGPLRKVILLEGVRAAREAVGQQALHRGPLDTVVVTEADQVGDAVRVELRLSQAVEQSVWQKAGAVYWDLRPASPAVAQNGAGDRPQPRAAPQAITLSSLAQEGSAAQKYRGKKITIDMQDAEIENILRLIGDDSGKNVIVGDDVKGRL